jgi:hypothetical protein
VVEKASQKVEDRFFLDGDAVRVEAWIEELEIPRSRISSRWESFRQSKSGGGRLFKDGRLRDVVVGPDGFLNFLTSHRTAEENQGRTTIRYTAFFSGRDSIAN